MEITINDQGEPVIKISSSTSSQRLTDKVLRLWLEKGTKNGIELVKISSTAYKSSDNLYEEYELRFKK